MHGQLFIRLLTGDDILVEAPVPVRWNGRAGRALLAVLSLHPGEAVSRDRLAGLLWSESDQHAARASLRMALLSLRRSLKPVDPGLIRATNDAITLNVGRELIDWALFEIQCTHADAEIRLSALDIYKGDLLATFATSTEAVSELLRDERERLREIAIDTGVGLLSVFEDIGDREQLRSVIRKILTIEPANEPAHQAMIRAYVAAGDRSAALRQYEQCCEALEEHYGLGPSTQTVELKAEIIGAETTEPPAPVPPLPDIAGDGNALPTVSPRQNRFRALHKLLWPALGLAISALVFLFYWRGWNNSGEQEITQQTEVVLSLQIDAEDRSANDIRKTFENGLSRIPGITLTTQAMPDDNPPVHAGSGYLVNVVATRSNSRLRVFITLRDSMSEEPLWQDRRDFDAPASGHVANWIETGLVKALELEIGSSETLN